MIKLFGSKKAQVVEIGLSVVMLVVALYGTYTTLKEGQHIYVGNTQTGEVYDYSFCSKQALEIPRENQILFHNLQQAIDLNYKPVEGCT